MVNISKKLRDLFCRPEARVRLRNVLVVEDGEVERKFISRSLEKHGLRVIPVENGYDGLDRARKERFDLVILDFHLPKLNGKLICESLKADPATRDIPVIFLTGSASPKDLIECYEAGAEYFLTKPISASQLIKQINAIFDELRPLESRIKRSRH